MSATMEASNLINKGNTLNVRLLITTKIEIAFKTLLHSPEFVICGSTVFQMKVLITRNVDTYHTSTSQLNYSVFIKFSKRHPDEDLNYTIKFTSKNLSITDKCLTSGDDWHVMKDICEKISEIDVAVQMYVVPSASSFSPLHEDTELLDFELQGVDGSVRFHKVVLAASSPVLRTMLGGAWRETTEGRVQVPGTSIKTLQYLKNYMYSHVIPDEDIEQLLLLSLYYMMPELEQLCVHRLTETLTSQTARDLLMFAGIHEINRLMLGILRCVNHNIDLDQICNHLLPEKKLTTGGDDVPRE